MTDADKRIQELTDALKDALPLLNAAAFGGSWDAGAAAKIVARVELSLEEKNHTDTVGPQVGSPSFEGGAAYELHCAEEERKDAIAEAVAAEREACAKAYINYAYALSQTAWAGITVPDVGKLLLEIDEKSFGEDHRDFAVAVQKCRGV